MTNIVQPASWADVPLLETTTAVLGGDGGPMNFQAKALVARTEFLDDKIDALTASNIDNVPSGTIGSTTVQGALNELDADVVSKVSSSTLAASSGASLVGYLPAGTGAVATTVHEQLRDNQLFEVYFDDAPWYGNSDGITDNYTAIVNALASTKRLMLGAGTYYCSQSLTITSLKQIVGKGSGLTAANSATVLKFPAGVSGILIDTNNAACSIIEGVFVDSSSTVAGSDVGIKVSAPRVHLKNVCANNFGSHGIHITSASGRNANQCMLTKARVSYNRGDGLHNGDAGEVDTNTLQADQLESVGNTGWGVWNVRGNGALLIKPLIDANGKGAIYDSSNGLQILHPYIESSETESTPLMFDSTVVDTTLDTITVTAHGLTDTTAVRFYGYGSALPAPLVATGIYYIVNAITNTLQVSATSGGAAIDLTSTGSAGSPMFVKTASADDIVFDTASSYGVMIASSFGAEPICKNGSAPLLTTYELHKGVLNGNTKRFIARGISSGTGTINLYVFSELTTGKTFSIRANIMGKERGGANRAGYIIHSVAQNEGGTVTLQGQTATSTLESNAAWNATFAVSTTLRLQATGGTGVIVDWYADIEILMND
jgi:hypothetical protein